MKKTLLLLLPLLAGCFTTKTPPVAYWTVVPMNAGQAVAEKPTLGEVRFAIVSVRSPYDGKELAVLRPDGSMAFDPYNQFAAVPSALIKGTALDILRNTGLFKGVQPGTTTADVNASLELTVDEFALDCRVAGQNRASVRLTLAMVRNRQVIAVGRGASAIDVTAGNYSVAFGSAFTKALVSAASQLVK